MVSLFTFSSVNWIKDINNAKIINIKVALLVEKKLPLTLRGKNSIKNKQKLGKIFKLKLSLILNIFFLENRLK